MLFALYNQEVRWIEQEFIVAEGLDAEAAEHLRHAARTLASSPPSLISAITSMHAVAAAQVCAYRVLALQLAEHHGLRVSFDDENPGVVRFSHAGVIT